MQLCNSQSLIKRQVMEKSQVSKFYSAQLGLLLITLIFSHGVFADPLKRSQAFVDAFKAISSNDEAAFKPIDEYIDFTYLSEQAIQPHRDKFNEDQVKVFKENFKSLIRLIAYPDTGKFFRENKYEYGKVVEKNNMSFVPMNVLVVAEDLDMELGYYWHQVDKQWRLADMSIDGDSLIKDYQNQFGRIINKDSVDELLKKLKNKIAEIKAKNNA